jgi:hypothetical protein
MKASQIISAAFLPAAALAAPCPHNCPTKPAAFFLAGDSTTATQSVGGGGWGDGFLSFLVPPAFGTNYGRNGRTTVDFVSQGWWDLVKASVTNASSTHDVVRQRGVLYSLIQLCQELLLLSYPRGMTPAGSRSS